MELKFPVLNIQNEMELTEFQPESKRDHFVDLGIDELGIT
jgi:hypothetical protein